VRTATEALALLQAQLSAEDQQQIKDVISLIDQHIGKHMTFAGVVDPTKKLEVLFHDLSQSAAQAVCLMLARKPYYWNVQARLMSMPPTFPGAAPSPHHWEMTFVPLPAAYEEAGVIPDVPAITLLVS